MSQARCCVCNPPLTRTLGGSGGHSGEAQDAQPFASSDLSSLETTVRTSAEKRPRVYPSLLPVRAHAIGLQMAPLSFILRQLNLHRNLERMA